MQPVDPPRESDPDLRDLLTCLLVLLALYEGPERAGLPEMLARAARPPQGPAPAPGEPPARPRPSSE